MKKKETQRINVVAFPAEKMEAVVEALRPILGSASGLFESDHGLQTGCTRTSTGDDWSCTDAMTFE